MSPQATQVDEPVTEDGRRTSFMTLVDAATSQLNSKPEQTDNASKPENVSTVSEESDAPSSTSSCGSVSADFGGGWHQLFAVGDGKMSP